MNATYSIFLQVAFAIMLAIFGAYVGGRVHQWYRQSNERDSAFRDGYNQASHALFPLATRTAQTQGRQRQVSTVGPRETLPSSGPVRE